LPPAKSAAENSQLAWTPAGDQLLLTLRPDEWRKQARDRFLAETKATVVVHSSKEPFLAWEDLRRMAAVRLLAAYDLKSSETRELIAQTKLNFTGSVDDKEPRQITGKKDEKKDEETGGKGDGEKEEKEKKNEKERFSAVRLSAKGDWLIASNKEGLWLVDAASRAKENFLKMNEEDKQAPRYQVIEWNGDDIYLTYAARTKWERGLVKYNCASKQMTELVKDARIYSNFRLSKDGKTFVFSAAEGNRPADLFVADSAFKTVRRLTEANPQLKAKRLSKTELISYLDVDGTRSYGVVYYPVDYEPGKKYPTVFNIYEQFFDDTFQGTINVLTNNGYAVAQPSLNLEQGFPGEAWGKGVTAAASTRPKRARTASAQRCGSSRKNTSRIPPLCSPTASKPRCC
jgi:dipeptidyl aminopeptidase/acylaminoacyl peptidase